MAASSVRALTVVRVTFHLLESLELRIGCLRHECNLIEAIIDRQNRSLVQLKIQLFSFDQEVFSHVDSTSSKHVVIVVVVVVVVVVVIALSLLKQ